jgi:hypothetical protein
VQARRRQQRSHELDVRESQEAGIDHVKIANGEPCCTNTPLVLMPKMGSRRSMRLRLKKSPHEPKMDPVDLEAAEWVNRVLANDPMVEVDPVTILERINAEKKVMPVATISTSEAPGIFHHSNGVPKIPQSVLLAAGSAIVLAFIALLVRALRPAKRIQGSSILQEDLQLSPQFASLGVRSEILEATPKVAQAQTVANAVVNDELETASISEGSLKGGDSTVDVETSSAVGGVGRGSAILTAFDVQPRSVQPAPPLHVSTPLPPSLSHSSAQASALEEVVSPHLPNISPSDSTDFVTDTKSIEEQFQAKLLESEEQDRATQIHDRIEANLSEFEGQVGVEASMSKFESLLSHLNPHKFLKFDDNTRTRDNHLQFEEQSRITSGQVFSPIPEDILDGKILPESEKLLMETIAKVKDGSVTTLETGPHMGLETVSSFSTLEAPVVTDDLDADHEISSSSNNSSSRVELSPDDILLAVEREAEERRNSAKYRALQAAFPAVAIGAGAVGALAGGNSLMHSEATFHQIVVIFGTTFCFFLGHDMLFFPFYAIWNRPNCHNIRQTLGTWTYSVVCSCVH